MDRPIRPIANDYGNADFYGNLREAKDLGKKIMHDDWIEYIKSQRDNIVNLFPQELAKYKCEVIADSIISHLIGGGDGKTCETQN